MSDLLNWLGDRSWLGWVALVVGGIGAVAVVMQAALRKARGRPPGSAGRSRTMLMLQVGLLVAAPGPVAAQGVCTTTAQMFVVKADRVEEFNALADDESTRSEAIRCCVACIPPKGTRVVTVDSGWLRSTVRVIDQGPYYGCQGDIINEALDCKPPGSGSDDQPADPSVSVDDSVKCQVNAETLVLRSGDDLAAVVGRTGTEGHQLQQEFRRVNPSCVLHRGDEVVTNAVHVVGGFTFWTVVKSLETSCQGVVLSLDGLSCTKAPLDLLAHAKPCTAGSWSFSLRDPARFEELVGSLSPYDERPLPAEAVEQFKATTASCRIRAGEPIVVAPLRGGSVFAVARAEDRSCSGITLTARGFDCP